LGQFLRVTGLEKEAVVAPKKVFCTQRIVTLFRQI
jgi:hypothetical protein